VERDLAAQQAVHAFAPVVQVGAQPADQQQVGLACLDEQAGRHPAGRVEVPRAVRDVRFGPDRAGAHGAGSGVDAGDTVGQQQRRTRHPGLADVVVLHGEHRAEQVGDPAAGEVFELGAVETGARPAARPGQGADGGGPGGQEVRVGLGLDGEVLGVRGGDEFGGRVPTSGGCGSEVGGAFHDRVVRLRCGQSGREGDGRAGGFRCGREVVGERVGADVDTGRGQLCGHSGQ
jgi:hypothetical protein